MENRKKKQRDSNGNKLGTLSKTGVTDKGKKLGTAYF